MSKSLDLSRAVASSSVLCALFVRWKVLISESSLDDLLLVQLELN